MKENSPLNSRLGERTKFVGVAFFACLILIFGNKIVGIVASSITTPFFVIRHYVETSSATVPVFIRSRIELLNQMRGLEEIIASDADMQASLSYVMEENRELRALLSASSTPRIIAGVIARPPYTPYDTMIIDRGSDAGIVEHAPVYFGTGRALGYIRKVFPQSALIALFSSPSVTSTVYVFGPNLFTTAYGEGGGIIRLSVPQGITVEEGNTVVLPGVDAGVVGTINHIQSIATEPEQHAYIAFEIPLQSIRLVSVGMTSLQPSSFEEATAEILELERTLFAIPVPAGSHFGTSTATSSAVILPVHTTTSSAIIP